MTKRRSTFGKMQRERDKAAKRIAKIERRTAARASSPEDATADVVLTDPEPVNAVLASQETVNADDQTP